MTAAGIHNILASLYEDEWTALHENKYREKDNGTERE